MCGMRYRKHIPMFENASQIFELKTRLWQMKQGDREVTEYYTKMLEEDREQRVFEFLAGLNRELDDVRSRFSVAGCCPSSERFSLRCDKRKAEGK
ncbi:hypothetical protein CK203_015029 [Vitis vinifera]|uniref:Retrotransposon gag domain-containing protein n=1 Tax=Vitis vinifera TaxID=29760 RepID=A0A438JD54_VITVI|nr:hypothetical protein CK203_015029 [Vitis vinifera]